ncbi:uncharacterized protein LOC117168379 isoform X2 [Belonocnema kinseyi]|uniref:uncharacterized protein LOC117168379 isoform X2 n=1 Tax=Belonocnema kinseyi TaxID=2817044 RepID=UPI00143DB2D3|nr:uncharacterized protein LOC117168379 isoform X2 [Belonocnema kinseyi]
MDTIMILYITLLLIVAAAPSYSENETAPLGAATTAASITTPALPIKLTTLKIVDVTNASDDDLPLEKSKREFGVGNSSYGNAKSFNKRIDPNFSSSLTSFDHSPSSLVSSDSVSGINRVKPSLKGSFNIDDISIKSKPSFDIDVPIKGSSSFNINGAGIKGTKSFDIDSPSFSLDGDTFSIGDDSFNLESPTFDIEGTDLKRGSSFSIGNTGFDIDGPTIKSIPSFNLKYYNAKRSPSYTPDTVVRSSSPAYNIETSESYQNPETYQKPQASDVHSKFSNSPNFDSITKKKYPKDTRESYNAPQSSYRKEYPKAAYSLTSPGDAYIDKSQYPGSHATPSNRVYNSYVTTPHYENYISPISSRAISGRPGSISKLKSPYSNPSEVSSHTTYGTPNQDTLKNNLFDDQGFEGNYAAFQNVKQNSFAEDDSSGTLQFVGSQTHIPVYNSQYPRQKNSHQNGVSFSPSTQSFDNLPQNLAYPNSPLEYNNKIVTSFPGIQLQSTQEFPKFIQSLETEPTVLTTGRNINLQHVPNFGLSSGFPKSNGNQPFLSTTNSYQQPQVLPVQSSRSTPQFPQYKGASIQLLSNNDYRKPAGIYQPLKSQPQLHFNTNDQAVNRPQKFVGSGTLKRIQEDVEIIKNNKKAPISQNDDSEEEEQDDDGDEDRDDELDEGYKSFEREYRQPFENYGSSESQIQNRDNGDVSPENYSDESEFKKEASEENGDEYATENHAPTKPPNIAYDKNSLKPYFSYDSPKPLRSAYDEDAEDADNEEETAKYEKQKDADERSSYENKGPVPYIRQYDKKSIDFYKKEPSKTKYAYVNQVSDTKESSAEDRTAYPKNSKYAKTKHSTPKLIYRGSYESAESAESTERSVKQGKKLTTKKPQKNNVEHETVPSYETDPRIIHEESFGYKIPKIEVPSRNSQVKENRRKKSSGKKIASQDSDSRYVKDNDGVKKYANVKKASTENTDVPATRGSYKSNAPKKGDATSYENVDSYSYSSGKKWKDNKKAPETADSQTYPTSDAGNVKYVTEDQRNLFSPERIRPRRNGSGFGDYTEVYWKS